MEDGNGKRVTPRLSAKAQPFRLSRVIGQPSCISSLTSLDPCENLLKSLSNVNLEGDPIPSGLNYGSDSLQGESSGQRDRYAYETLLGQRKPVKKSKHFNGNSGSSNDGGIFSFTAVDYATTPYEFPVFPASAFRCISQPELPYTAPVASCNQTNSPMTFDDSRLTNCVPCTGNPTFPDLESFSSDSCNRVPPLKTILLRSAENTGKTSSHKANERKFGKAVSSEALDSLPTSKSLSEGTLKKLHGNSSLECQAAEEAITKFDGNDSDVDSPCYKGLANGKAPHGFSRSLSSHSIKNLQEASYSLNPRAPHFIPRPSKAIVNCYVNQYDAGNLSSLGKAVPGTVGAVSSFSKENMSVDKAGEMSSLLINGIDKTSNNFNESKREHDLLDKSGSDSALSKGVSKFVSTKSKIDATTVLDRMHDMSSFLLENCSIGDLLNGRDLIQLIVNNLCMCIEKSNRGKSPMPDLMVSGTSNFPNKSTEIIESSSRGFQLRNAEAFDVPHELSYQNLIDRFGYTERMLDSFPSDSNMTNIGAGKSIHTIQVMGNAVRENSLTKDEIDSEALVYQKLWLESEATVRAMKYERCVMQEIAYGMTQSKHN